MLAIDVVYVGIVDRDCIAMRWSNFAVWFAFIVHFRHQLVVSVKVFRLTSASAIAVFAAVLSTLLLIEIPTSSLSFQTLAFPRTRGQRLAVTNPWVASVKGQSYWCFCRALELLKPFCATRNVTNRVITCTCFEGFFSLSDLFAAMLRILHPGGELSRPTHWKPFS